MTENNSDNPLDGNTQRQPIFNVPAVVVWLIASFAVVHLFRQFASPAIDEWIILHFAFSPARMTFPDQFPGGLAAMVWSFVTHAFLHGSWEHLLINCFWMLAFGTVLARRFGWVRFSLFSLAAAAAGATGNLFAYWGEYSLMVGASGAISGHMAGAIRLMFSIPGGLGNMQMSNFETVGVLKLGELMRVRGAVIFVSVWLVANLVFGFSGFGTGGGVGRIAWEAHLGGFLAGLLLFGLFDRRQV